MLVIVTMTTDLANLNVIKVSHLNPAYVSPSLEDLYPHGTHTEFHKPNIDRDFMDFVWTEGEKNSSNIHKVLCFILAYIDR